MNFKHFDVKVENSIQCKGCKKFMTRGSRQHHKKVGILNLTTPTFAKILLIVNYFEFDQSHKFKN